MPVQPRIDLLRWDMERDEPYLILPSLPDFRLTPRRLSDGDDAVRLFNSPGVGKYSYRRPYPYTHKDIQFTIENTIPSCHKTIENNLRLLIPLLPMTLDQPAPNLNNNGDNPNQIPFFPFITIRHTTTNQFIGDIQLYQSMSTTMSDTERLAAFNGNAPMNDLKPKDQKWEIAYNLLSEYHGKGIMSSALSVMIESWVLWVGIGTLIAQVETANPNSAGLVISKGFKKSKTYMVQWPEEKGGGEREVSEWVLKVSEYQPRKVLK